MGIDSPYLFVSQIGERPYRGSAVLRELAEEAQVSDLSLFTATSLRKQLATLSQFLEISKFNQDHLATYLGRSQKHILSACGSCSFLFKVNTGVKVHETCPRSLEEETITQGSDDGGDSDSDSEYHDLSSLSSHHNDKVSPSTSHSENMVTSFSELVHDTCPGSLEEETITQGSDDGSDSDNDSEYHDLPSSSSHHNDKVSPSTSHSENMITSSQSCPKVKSKKSQVKRLWSREEAAAVQRHLASCLILNRIPQKHTCERALAAASSPKENVGRPKVLCLQHAEKG